MQFKTTKIKEEYNELTAQNKKLKTVLDMLDLYCMLEFKKEITLTHLFRTKEEHEKLYAQTPEHKRPKSSPHMFWNACDIRSWTFTDKEKDKMLRFLNCFNYKSGQGRPVAIVHTIAGNVEHFHIQCN